MKYKYFIVRICNLLLILGLLAAYQTALYVRSLKEEMVQMETEINQLKGEKETLLRTAGLSDASGSRSGGTEAGISAAGNTYTDGTYQGTADGFGGPVEVSVEVKDGQIKKVDIVSAKEEDEAYLSLAKNIIDDMINQQTTKVDTISGATYSSGGIKGAVEAALKGAVK